MPFIFAARLVYKSGLYRKSSAERRLHIQVSPVYPIIRLNPEDLSRRTRRKLILVYKRDLYITASTLPDRFTLKRPDLH